jgi:Ala-tRNA(Pro) deacylase
VVKADDDFIVCALPASYRLDMSKLARTLQARNVRLADESEMADLFPDVEVGAEPPMGQLWNLPTYVDQHLAKGNEIVFQAGTHSHAIRMKFADYENLTKPRIADLAVRM